MTEERRDDDDLSLPLPEDLSREEAPAASAPNSSEGPRFLAGVKKGQGPAQESSTKGPKPVEVFQETAKKRGKSFRAAGDNSKTRPDGEEEDYFAKKKRLEQRRLKLGAAAGVGLVAVIGGVLVFGNPFSGYDPSKHDGGAAVEVAPIPEDVPTVVDEEKGIMSTPWWQKDGGNNYPVNKEAWQLSTPENAKDEDIIRRYSNTDLYRAAQMLPSEVGGLTTDLSQVGKANYVIATSESVIRGIGSAVERLINPDFGDWGAYQYDGTLPMDQGSIGPIFESMYTPEAWEAALKDPKNRIPIYGDWNNDAYGLKGTLMDEGPRWMGEVKNIKVDGKGKNDMGDYEFKVTVNVEYSAWARSQEKLTRAGVLTLDMITNSEYLEKDSVLIQNATLVVTQ